MKKKRKCCICGKVLRIGEWGNNPEPIKPMSSGTCCNECNMKWVIPERVKKVISDRKGEQDGE